VDPHGHRVLRAGLPTAEDTVLDFTIYKFSKGSSGEPFDRTQILFHSSWGYSGWGRALEAENEQGAWATLPLNPKALLPLTRRAFAEGHPDALRV